MYFVFAIILSVLITAMAIIRPSDENAVILKRFTYKKQLLTSCIFNVVFLVAILVIGVCQPPYNVVCMLLAVVQLCINVIFISVLRLVGKKKFRQLVINEITRLDIDINEDPIVIRRKLMENSEMSYSIKDIQAAIADIRAANRSKSK